MFGNKKKNLLTEKVWIPLVDGQVHSFDQTNGALASLDTVPVDDPRGPQRIAEGAAISGMAGGMM